MSRTPLAVAGLQVVMFTIICVNIRAVAQADYAVAVLTDLLYASANFFVIRSIVLSPDSLPMWVGYVAGSMIGTVLGIYISTP